jgi:hypothetical protein
MTGSLLQFEGRRPHELIGPVANSRDRPKTVICLDWRLKPLGFNPHSHLDCHFASAITSLKSYRYLTISPAFDQTPAGGLQFSS